MTDGTFEGYGGRHVPDPLQEPLEQLAAAYDDVANTDEFQSELRGLLEEFAGRPTPLYYARNLSERYDAEIYLKREDLLHGGAHKINNCLGQALLAKRAGRDRLIAETGAGQHGTATAMVGALLGLERRRSTWVRKDIERQEMNVFRMRLMGAEVNEVTRGDEGLADAVDAALGTSPKTSTTPTTWWEASSAPTRSADGSGLPECHWTRGPRADPGSNRRPPRRRGRLCRRRLERDRPLPRLPRRSRRLLRCRGRRGGSDSSRHAAPLAKGTDDVLHGMKTRVIDDDVDVHSPSPRAWTTRRRPRTRHVPGRRTL